MSLSIAKIFRGFDAADYSEIVKPSKSDLGFPLVREIDSDRIIQLEAVELPDNHGLSQEAFLQREEDLAAMDVAMKIEERSLKQAEKLGDMLVQSHDRRAKFAEKKLDWAKKTAAIDAGFAKKLAIAGLDMGVQRAQVNGTQKGLQMGMERTRLNLFGR